MDVMILDDDMPEGDERFQLLLTNPSPGLELGKNTIGSYLSFHSLLFFHPGSLG